MHNNAPPRTRCLEKDSRHGIIVDSEAAGQRECVAWQHLIRDVPIPLPEASAQTDNANERVIKSLSCALEAAEHGHVDNCAEALKLAIGLLGIRSKNRAVDEPVDTESTGRRVQALQKWRLKRVIEYVDAHLSDRISLPELAAVAGLSRMHFASQFRVATGIRPHEFILRRRIRRAQELLQHTDTTIVEVALSVGFQTQPHFTTVFKRLVRCTPRRWRTINQVWPAQQARGNGLISSNMGEAIVQTAW
jgi:AraC family transcriptional regulator